MSKQATQIRRVRNLMLDGRWRTLWDIQDEIGSPRASETSISARLRDLRKSEHGGYAVERRLIRPGTYEYRVLEPSVAHDVRKDFGQHEAQPRGSTYDAEHFMDDGWKGRDQRKA